MPIRAVLFDIDGTLVDSNEQHVNAWAFAFRDEGHPQERDDIRAQIGKGGDLLVPALLPTASEDVRQRIADAQGAHFKTIYLDQIRPFADAAALVRHVHHSGRKVVLASSAKQEELDHYIELLELDGIIDATSSIDDVETSKPEPDIFAVALEKVSVAADDAIVIGDTIYDVAAALRAGIVTIGVTSGPFDERQLRDAGAIAVYRDVAALLAHFDRSPLGGPPVVADGHEAALRADDLAEPRPGDDAEIMSETPIPPPPLSEEEELSAEAAPELRVP
ncbi:HAD family hydrolase [Sphingomonas sp. MMS24-J13]|uniref:HAD family hydrolase n=1 Tax=Sphingomonas sp. MMS24-J13 TaxID=3238686 RepID=UPI00384AE519